MKTLKIIKGIGMIVAGVLVAIGKAMIEQEESRNIVGSLELTNHEISKMVGKYVEIEVSKDFLGYRAEISGFSLWNKFKPEFGNNNIEAIRIMGVVKDVYFQRLQAKILKTDGTISMGLVSIRKSGF